MKLSLARGGATLVLLVTFACSSGSGGGGFADAGLEGGGGSGGTGTGATSGTGASGGSAPDAGQCKQDGQPCAGFAECCSNMCDQGHCGGVACVPEGGDCTVFGDCCGGTCAAGKCTAGTASYPPGPYGVDVGNTLEDLALPGLFSWGATVETLHASDFLNVQNDPSKPALLVITLGAAWCAPCAQAEAASDYAYWKSQRVAFITVLGEGYEPGVAATEADLLQWVSSHQPQHVTMLDPSFSHFASVQSLPLAFFVDTRTMKILHVTVGGAVYDANNTDIPAFLSP